MEGVSVSGNSPSTDVNKTLCVEIQMWILLTIYYCSEVGAGKTDMIFDSEKSESEIEESADIYYAKHGIWFQYTFSVLDHKGISRLTADQSLHLDYFHVPD